MLNDDLIAHLQPAPNRFRSDEWRDVTGAISDIRVLPHRFELRAALVPGRYRGRIETFDGAFDFSTAMLSMVRVPDGKRVAVGPWDLNHIDNHMAIPMARVSVDGNLKGGLWFEMPGPGGLAAGRLSAELGFEALEPVTRLVMEFVERDRDRINWTKVRSIQIRRDDRNLCPITPRSGARPRVFVTADELPAIRDRLMASPAFKAVVARIQAEEIKLGGDPVGNADLASLVWLVTSDKKVGLKIKDKIVELCRMESWAGRPDPLIMGGDNDRGVGNRLYYTALAWDWIKPLFTPPEQEVVLAKAAQYIQKMYDFTLLQRGYMGCPTSEPHSLGSWNGVGIACMAFYDDLTIAQKALPFFHGLFRDSLTLFPPGGKTTWATYFPVHLLRYLAASHTFGGHRDELESSPFLDNLGKALLACFETPNTQELHRGLRTKEHRYITSFLCRFHRTPGIEAIHQAFVDQELKSAGNLELGFFDFLYAPSGKTKAADFPDSPLLVKDIGDVICVARGKKTIGLSMGAGLKAGARATFSLMPHNREYSIQMGAIEVSVDHSPVLVNINLGCYSQDSANINAMCFEEGGMVSQGQYLNGDIGPECNAYLRRCFINERFVFAHAVITGSLQPRLAVRRADRLLVLDLKSGTAVVADSFEGDRPIRIGTHLHCAGSVRDLGSDRYRLTGGQANLIAGIKYGARGLSDEEKGEIFVSVLKRRRSQRVVVSEASWIPAYIYGLNNNGKEELSQGRFPRYNRWRLEESSPAASASFIFALSAGATDVKLSKGWITGLHGSKMCLGPGKPAAILGCTASAEALLADEASRKLVLVGADRFTIDGKTMSFAVPVDAEIDLSGRKAKGRLLSPAANPITDVDGFTAGKWNRQAVRPDSVLEWATEFAVT